MTDPDKRSAYQWASSGKKSESVKDAESRVTLILGFVGIIVLLVSVAVIGIVRISEINRGMKVIVTDNNVKARLINTMYNSARERTVVLLIMINIEDPFERDEEYLRFNALGAKFAEARLEFNNMVLDDTESRLLEEQLKRVQHTVPLQEKVLDAMVADDLETAITILRNEALPSQNRILDQFRLMVDYQQDKTEKSLLAANKTYSESVTYITVLAMIASVVSILIAIFVVRKTHNSELALRQMNLTLEQRVAERTGKLETQAVELKGLRDEAVEANRHKSEFLANMSHELRTPLNAVIGFSEVLKERMFGELNEKQGEYIEDIHSSGRHLLSLINDILDLAKIEAGRMELNLSAFELPVAIENSLVLVKERASRHSITLQSHIDERLGQFVADERKFKQIMLNLLSNAIKFTPDGGQVSVLAVKEDDVLKVSVQDTGIGIAVENLDKVFDEFQQVGSTSDMKHQGTGLGLALTRTFVEMHGGELHVESELNKGSTFIFTLPIQA